MTPGANCAMKKPKCGFGNQIFHHSTSWGDSLGCRLLFEICNLQNVQLSHSTGRNLLLQTPYHTMHDTNSFMAQVQTEWVTLSRFSDFR